MYLFYVCEYTVAVQIVVSLHVVAGNLSFRTSACSSQPHLLRSTLLAQSLLALAQRFIIHNLFIIQSIIFIVLYLLYKDYYT